MIKAGKAPDYRDREQGSKTNLQRRLVGMPQRIENELEICERGIETGLNSAASALRTAGKYVKRVLTKELWRKGNYSGFDDWCDKRWGWTRQRGYQIAEGQSVLESLPSKLSTMVDNERQARALIPVKESARPAVLTRVIESGKPVTARAIKKETRPRELKQRKTKAAPIVIEPQPRVHDCPMCRCGE